MTVDKNVKLKVHISARETAVLFAQMDNSELNEFTKYLADLKISKYAKECLSKIVNS